jgi:chromosome segregation protein
MLKLHKLHLSGFKSFVDDVDLDFAGGLTAIVGPNGCGKSNLADAVVWVLGERSAKSLRGETMEDVIFAGSESRKSLGMAEVSLELEASEEVERAEEGRITLGRRVHRSGESQYSINGKRVRLKEIKDLLMDTGLGIRAYSMIEQGKIGQILSGKPLERRRLLEEAAGVTRYRERRRIAEIKLEEAGANLARLDDIVSEVGRSMRSLKRQAGAARRYQERQQQYRDLLRKVLVGRWTAVHLRQVTTESNLQALVAEEAETSATLQRSEADNVKAREEVEQHAEQLGEQHRRDAESAASIEGKQEFLKGSRRRLEEMAERIVAGKQLIDHRQKQIKELSKMLADLAERRQALSNDLSRAASEVDQDDHKISSVEALASEAGERLETFRSSLLSALGEITGLRNRMHQEQLEREKGQIRRQHLGAEMKTKSQNLEAATTSLAAAEKEVREHSAHIEQCETTLEDLNESVELLEADREVEADALEDLEGELRDLNQRVELLDELSRTDDQRRQALQEALAESGLDAAEFLSTQFKVIEGWEESLDLFLGSVTEAVILPGDEDGLNLARSLVKSSRSGRLIRAMTDHSAGQQTTNRPDDPAILYSLAESLSLPPELAAALPPAYLVDSATDAERLARLNPEVAFISREGIWAQAGVLHVSGDRSELGQLSRSKELQESAAQIEPLESQQVAHASNLEDIDRRLEEKKELIREQEIDLSELRSMTAVAKARHEDLVARHHRLGVETRTLEVEFSETDRELKSLAGRSDLLATQLETAETTHASLEKDFDRAQAEVDDIRQDREEARTSGASRKGRLELLEERLAAHRQESQRIEREIEEGRQQIQAWVDEGERIETRQAEITAAVERTTIELQEALEGRASSRDQVIALQERLDQSRTDLREAEAAATDLREKRDQLRDQLGEVRIDEATSKQEAEQLQTTYREEFGEDFPEGKQPEDASAEHPPAELEAWQADLDRSKEVLERMGPVNLLAADEFTEHEERHTFLAQQHEDVVKSVESLRSTIREINETSSKRFRETFEKVNEFFGQTFVDLFRGGEAEMRLLDEDDVLESGIEIVARPPGKRLQNLMLLSGGEKALTAIALLFALFRLKPSPFCILDEVDAPLDDVNTLRFVEMVKKMSGDTQFVMITHNKLTMEACSMLYGVTMQERGVSNLVSVSLDEVQPAEQDSSEAVSA